MTTNPIFCALDTPDVEKAVSLAKQLTGSIGGAKLGMEFFYANGIAGYRAVLDAGLPIFLDLKLHDISNTVAKAVHSLMPLAPKIMTVHTQGGPGMMCAASEAATEAAKATGVERPKMVGVTILTSLDRTDLASIGVEGAVKDQVVRLGRLAKASGLDGVVCSPLEIEVLRDACGDDFMLVVPGIRPAGSPLGDQKRVLTPREAVDKGADVLVIGRPITGADDPAASAQSIADSLK